MDEVWEGIYHMVLAPSGPHATVEAMLIRLLGPYADSAGLTVSGQCNIGESEHDFRVPDAALHRRPPTGVWNATAALVVEVVSPGDESWEKLSFYAAHRIDEVLIVDPRERTVDWLALDNSEYTEIKRSRLIDVKSRELAEQIDWPAS
jgi:Uma2 family endonuclease